MPALSLHFYMRLLPRNKITWIITPILSFVSLPLSFKARAKEKHGLAEHPTALQEVSLKLLPSRTYQKQLQNTRTILGLLLA